MENYIDKNQTELNLKNFHNHIYYLKFQNALLLLNLY